MNKLNTKELIKHIYQNVSGYISYSQGQIEQLHKEDISPTYGEILYDSISQIISHINLNKEDVFYDLGSGVGKIVVQFFLESPIKKACGIEALEYRHQEAIKVLDFLKKENPQLFHNRELIFNNGNIIQHNIEDATIIFMNSLCFNENLLNKINMKIKNNKSLKYIISNTKIPIDIMPNQQQLTIQSSWSEHSNFYIFSKLPQKS